MFSSMILENFAGFPYCPDGLDCHAAAADEAGLSHLVFVLGGVNGRILQVGQGVIQLAVLFIQNRQVVKGKGI